MNEVLEIALRAVALGVGASALMDVWGLVLRRGLGVPTLDYALLGRWLGHMRHGRFTHDRIGASAPVRHERALGWAAHYGIGITFAVLLLVVWGLDWAHSPSLLPPLVVGFGTIVAPWFLMQPAMGAGIAGARTPNPTATRLRNLGTHAVYGFGLYGMALVLA
jgi:hypothetical protein